jgi:hypothetical protein
MRKYWKQKKVTAKIERDTGLNFSWLSVSLVEKNKTGTKRGVCSNLQKKHQFYLLFDTKIQDYPTNKLETSVQIENNTPVDIKLFNRKESLQNKKNAHHSTQTQRLTQCP